MKKLFKKLSLNFLVSIFFFCVFLYIFSGTSGGDIAVLFFTLILGFIQIFLVLYYSWKSKKELLSLILLLLGLIFLELIILMNYGLEINNFIVKLKN